MVNKSKYFSDT